MADVMAGDPVPLPIEVWLAINDDLPAVGDAVYMAGPRAVTKARAIGRPLVGSVRRLERFGWMAMALVVVPIDAEVDLVWDAPQSVVMRPRS